MDDLLSEFLTETTEGLAVLDVELVKLEQNPNDQELLSNIFRYMHTIKGTCGFLGLPRLESVAHAGENILGKFREGALEVTPKAVSLILECLDTIRTILEFLEQNEAEPEGEDADLIARLNAYAEHGESAGGEATVETAPEGENETPEVEAVATEGEQEVAASEPPEESKEEDVPEAVAAAPTPAPAPEMKPANVETPETKSGGESSVANQSIRVNVDLLENLMTMVSEMVLTRNQLLQILRGQKDSEFAAPLQRLNHVVSELQEGVMKTRMQPIGNAWAKLPRIIRDLSIELDKKIELVMKGAETELDRQVLELIKDPLTHMVRNSADHGLETTAGRIEAGKPEIGKVVLKAYHEGGHIIISIADDGRGLPIEVIKNKIIANGLATETELETMSEQQIQRFIFKAGFSTASSVTSVSGRGVGMDVVRTNIEKIGGTVELTSTEGKGTAFIIKIPLTLAIVSALIVECAGDRFAIPQLSVLELVRASVHSENTIERINNTPVLRLRNRLLPLVNLRDLMNLNASGETEATSSGSGDESATEEKAANLNPPESGEGFIVVSQVGSYSFGIIVDRVFDTEEIVVKPVPRIMRDNQMFSGNTILGDGSVVMILDPNGIASATGEVELAEESGDTMNERHAVQGEETVAMLVFRVAGDNPKAVPLGLVARLEEVELDKVEFSNGQQVVQYRGHLMPLVIMEGAKELGTEGRQPVLVFTDRDRTMGLVVDEIVDIVEERLNIELTSKSVGYVGSAVIDGHATDVLDVAHYLTLAFHDWFGGEAKDSFGDEEASRLLLVDDSPFFRNLLQPLLSVAGYEVSCSASASEALQRCEAGEKFDVIISDIEMPGMSGFEFAEAVKKDTSWSDVPMVALSSFATQKDLDRGREVGFVDYVAKSDREALLGALHEALVEIRGAA